MLTLTLFPLLHHLMPHGGDLLEYSSQGAQQDIQVSLQKNLYQNICHHVYDFLFVLLADFFIGTLSIILSVILASS